MSDDARKKDGGRLSPADEAAFSARLRQLGERLDQAGAGRSSPSSAPSSPTTDASGFARGFRLSAELVGGVVVGFLFGWVLDYWLGTKPWGLIVFLLLGFAGGVLNVMRSAGVIAERKLPDQGGTRD